MDMKQLGECLEHLAFVSGVFLGATEGRDFITVEDAQANIDEWRNEGVEIPEGLDGFYYAQMWNTMVTAEEEGVF